MAKGEKGADLERDSIKKLTLRLALPAVAAQIVNMLYNIVDRIFIGHIPDIGREALTGVGVALPIIVIVSAFSALFGLGGSPHASIKMGQGDNDGAEKVVGNCFTMLAGVSVMLTVGFLLFGEQLLILFGASEATLPYALSYINIYLCGTIFVEMAIGMNSFISGQGFAKTAMLTVLVGAVLNLILDPIFIFVFNMGVQGAAIATVISQAVSAIWVVKFMMGKTTVLRLKKKNLRLSKKIVLPVLALGISPFIMQSTESLVTISLNSSLQQYGGDLAVGAMTILASVMQVVTLPLMGLTQGVRPIISFNYGANRPDRVKESFKLLIIMSMGYTVFFWAISMFAPNVLVSLFTNNSELAAFTSNALRIFMAGSFMLGAQFACQQTFVGLGEAKISLLLALLRKVVLLIPLIYILPLFFADKVNAIFISEPVADVAASIVTVLVFVFRFKKILEKPIKPSLTPTVDEL